MVKQTCSRRRLKISNCAEIPSKHTLHLFYQSPAQNKSPQTCHFQMHGLSYFVLHCSRPNPPLAKPVKSRLQQMMDVCNQFKTRQVINSPSDGHTRIWMEYTRPCTSNNRPIWWMASPNFDKLRQFSAPLFVVQRIDEALSSNCPNKKPIHNRGRESKHMRRDERPKYRESYVKRSRAGAWESWGAQNNSPNRSKRGKVALISRVDKCGLYIVVVGGVSSGSC